MLDIVASNQFKKDLKLAAKRGLNLSHLNEVVTALARREKLDDKYRDHNLTGDYRGFRECHIEPDWLLVYMINDNALVLTATGTGSHADLFDM